MTTLQEAARDALEALERIGKDFVCRSAHHAKKDQHSAFAECPVVVRHTDAIESLKAALAQQREQAKPVAYITQTEQGDMVWTPEMYGEACTYCDDAEFPVPLYTAAPAPQAHPEVDGGEFVNGVWRGVAAPQPVVNQQMTTVKESLTHQSAQPVAPLTDDQIKSMWAQYCGYPGGILDFARAVREVK